MLHLHLRRRVARWRKPVPEALTEFWSHPLPGGGAAVEALKFLVCDAEMSGLDPERGELLSLGWVRIEDLEIVLDSAAHQLLRSDRGVGQSATIHRLRDCELRGGLERKEALELLLAAARDHVLVFHNASLDMAFLNRAAEALWGLPLLAPTLDTLRIEERLLRRRSAPVGEGMLRLPVCRERYGLAPHRGHSALTDALATAELFLAQIGHRGRGLRLRDLA